MSSNYAEIHQQVTQVLIIVHLRVLEAAAYLAIQNRCSSFLHLYKWGPFLFFFFLFPLQCILGGRSREFWAWNGWWIKQEAPLLNMSTNFSLHCICLHLCLNESLTHIIYWPALFKWWMTTAKPFGNSINAAWGGKREKESERPGSSKMRKKLAAINKPRVIICCSHKSQNKDRTSSFH